MEETQQLSDLVIRKFVEVNKTSEWSIETPTGYKPIISSNKTIPYEVFRVTLQNGLYIDCADTHILITESGSEVFAKDSVGISLQTTKGSSEVLSVAPMGFSDNMYDLTIDSDDHTYYTNDILSHNTTTAAAYMLWYSNFNANKFLAILANKRDAAREVMYRYQFMFENLPYWMQQGVTGWNKGDIELENKTRVITAATSSSGIRGKACVTGDTIIYISEHRYIIPVKIGDYYQKLLQGDIPKKVIYTPKGLRPFGGIVNQGIPEKILRIVFDDDTYLSATPDHRVLNWRTWQTIDQLRIGELFSARYIVDIYEIEPEEVYDVYDVQDGSCYFTGDVISHNCNFLYVDEAAFIPNTVADEFFASVIPTLSSGETTKMLVTSTPKGYNHFWKMWNDAENKRNDFVPVYIPYYVIPGRDAAWAERERRSLGDVRFAQEVTCVGKDTLITVKDKTTGKIFELNIAMLYEKL